MKTKMLLVAIICPIVYAECLSAQGCSDAGFCSITHFTGKKQTPKSEWVIGAAYGIGEKNVNVVTPYIIYNQKIGKNWLLGNKVTASYYSGSLGSVFGAGDLYSVATYSKNSLYKKTNWLFSGGLKIPLTNANQKLNNQPLPMAYQSSIGSFDAIGSIGLNIGQLNLNTAVQVPFSQINQNSFLKENSASNDFPSTNQFRRKSDVLLRGGYTFAKNNWTFKPNLLNILHLGKDSYENMDGKRMDIAGSSGLTINLNLVAQLALQKKNYLEFSIATPLLVREVRPDGLTRSLTAGIEYHFL